MELGQISDIRSGSLFERDDSGVRYVQVGDLADRSIRRDGLSRGLPPARSAEDAALLAGDIVIGLRGNYNNAAVVPKEVGTSDPLYATLDVGVIRVGQEGEPAYVAWFINLPSTQTMFAAARSGSAAPRLPLSALKALDIPLPSIERQRAIIAIAALSEHERGLQLQLREARSRLVDQLLRQAAEEGSAPGCNPVRTDHRPTDRNRVGRAFSNRQDWSS